MNTTKIYRLNWIIKIIINNSWISYHIGMFEMVETTIIYQNVAVIMCMCINILAKKQKVPCKNNYRRRLRHDITILANTPNQADTLLHSLERAAAGIGLHVNAHKTDYMCYNQTGHISTLDGTPVKLVRQIHLPMKQRLSNRKGHRHAANEGMDSYR